MEFTSTPEFDKLLKKYAKKHKSFIDDFSKTQKLLLMRFDGEMENIISADKLHRIKASNDYNLELWKIEAMQRGLRPSQWPRVWFGIGNGKLIFLPIHSHTENYNDNKESDRAWKDLVSYTTG